MAITDLILTSPAQFPKLEGEADGQVLISYSSDAPHPTLFQVIATHIDANGIPVEGDDEYPIVGSAAFIEEGIYEGSFVDRPISIETTYLNPDYTYSFSIKATDLITDATYYSNAEAPIDIICFTTGTLIATANGEIAVENLRIGDLVVTMHGTPTMRPIHWIGRTSVSIAKHPNRQAVAPILIVAGALAEGTPHRDLRVSPDHAMFLDGHLVPARLLVNGTSIIQELWRDEVTYWHVELPAHGLLVSEGAVSESYFDDGNRQNFDNYVVSALVKDFESHRANGQYRTHACAPLAVESSPALIGIRLRIAARADTVQQKLLRVA